MRAPSYPIALNAQNLVWFTNRIEGVTAKRDYSGRIYIELRNGTQRYLFYEGNAVLSLTPEHGLCLITNNGQFEKRFHVRPKKTPSFRGGRYAVTTKP